MSVDALTLAYVRKPWHAKASPKISLGISFSASSNQAQLSTLRNSTTTPQPRQGQRTLSTAIMARNSEKAQSMLFRFRESQAADLGILDIGRTRRPKAITSVTSIPSCEKWRGQVLKEISRKVSRIQEASLSDYMIRDLNDEINKAMKEKWMWEVQIRNLGGPNYMRGGGKVYDEEGREIPGGGKGYKYVFLKCFSWEGRLIVV